MQRYSQAKMLVHLQTCSAVLTAGTGRPEKNLHYVVGNLGGTKIPARCPLSKVAILTVPIENKVPHSTKSKFELSNALTEMFLDHRHDLGNTALL